ncbi:undecaprenyl-diphosphatase [Acidihalobacter yilgarnensis]|uniref:Undecaprenyl-diphosphatase n=1 Tax=Acidihalobacter yilgarnensis TaxID=2819280 RepID=A0A1D8IRC4_9GAMM|nr:undecaprenyl-diphosphate phosphatase [Acidihalobacter yilgarnensis]AOU98933.1 undecaprenyl-diphosphatase [Acidihalobacter yilgarnensis]
MTEPSSLHLFLMAILQGVTELFPISSLGHSVLVPGMLHWPIDRDAPWFLPFIVVLHLGTASALLIYFWRDWWRLFNGLWRARGGASNAEARLFWMLVTGTIPAGLIGLALHHQISRLFGLFELAAIFLMINGLMLLIGDSLKRRTPDGGLDKLTWGKALVIGLAQSIALIPGMSRSGATLVAGLGAGLDYAASARFSFLLATPIIAAAGVLEVPKLLHHGVPGGLVHVIVLAGLLAGVCAWFSTWFLMRWFSEHEVSALRPYAIYCMLLGALALWVG